MPDREIRALCEVARKWAREELQLPELRLVWVDPSHPGLPWGRFPDRVGGEWHSVGDKNVVGWVNKHQPTTAYVIDQSSSGLPRDRWLIAAPVEVLHEARHCWQGIQGWRGTEDEREADAYRWG